MPPNGLPQWHIARPQCAIAHEGSAASTLVNVSDGGPEFKGMQKSDGAIEIRPRFRLARCFEVDGAELLGAATMLFVLREREHRTGEQNG